MKSRFTRKHRACGGIANCDIARFTKSPSCSHRCEYIQHQPRPFTRRLTSPPSHVGHSRTLARDVAGVNLLDPEYKVAPWWSASGDLTARTRGRTSPEHSMVVSQWSSSEHKVLQSPWRTSAHPERCPRTARGGARVAAATDSTGGQASHTRPRNLGAGLRISTHQVPPNPNPRGTSVRRWEGSHHIGAEVQGSPWYCYFGPIRAFR